MKKYFNAKGLQEKLNQNCQQLFDEFAFKMTEQAQVQMKSSFRETWDANRLPDRPGILADEFKPVLFKYYRQIKNEVLEMVREVKSDCSQSFNSGLLSLIGFSNSDILKVVLEYDSQGLGECSLFSAPEKFSGACYC